MAFSCVLVRDRSQPAKFGNLEIRPRKNEFSRRKNAARPEGLEPSAYGLEIRCSVQLSYGRKCSAVQRFEFGLWRLTAGAANVIELSSRSACLAPRSQQ